MHLDWQFKPFKELSLSEFHDIIALRLKAFVIEQNCTYLDLDGKDKKAYHAVVRDGKGDVVATGRILSPGVSFQEVAIGRVVVAKDLRESKVGTELMEKCIQFIYDEFGKVPIKISAQKHLENFYNKFGFISTGKEYNEDSIPHVEMLLEIK